MAKVVLKKKKKELFKSYEPFHHEIIIINK